MVPLGFVTPRAGYPIFVLSLKQLEDLLPGATPGLDVICDGILHGSSFTFDETKAPLVSNATVT